MSETEAVVEKEENVNSSVTETPSEVKAEVKAEVKTEAEVYKVLHQKLTAGETSGGMEESVGIPHIYWFGTGFLWNKDYYNILVMENLGSDLDKLLLQTAGDIAQCTKLVLGCSW